jgi:hypothetical protein
VEALRRPRLVYIVRFQPGPKHDAKQQNDGLVDRLPVAVTPDHAAGPAKESSSLTLIQVQAGNGVFELVSGHGGDSYRIDSRIRCK